MSDRLQQDVILDEYQRQELEEISNLNRNIDISGNDLDHVQIFLCLPIRSMIALCFTMTAS